MRTSTGVRWLGWLLVASGLAVLAWGAWQFWGTSWLSQREHREIVRQLEISWQGGGPAGPGQIGAGAWAGAGQTGAATGAGQTVAGWPAEQVLAVVRIPALGENYAVPLLEGTSDAVLAAGFGHLQRTPAPGRVGNVALAAHRITHGEPLRRMPELDPGDEIVVETRRAVHTYVLDTGGDDLEVPFDQSWVLDALPTNPRAGGVQPPSREPGQRLITLTTCAELFHTDQRLVAFGHLVDTVRK